MAYQSLYRRYRPRRFGEVRGQEHVVTALRNAAREGRTGHAYLFSGPRGTGKTTTARILAKVLNCENPVDGEPCLECDSCRAIEAGSSLDVHELDAASNRGIDDIRRIIEGAAVSSGGRTKLYILDEVHMLTEPAENALLKTLEEPPEHVVFVLATTDPQKVRPTIRSRTQHYEFHLLPAVELESYVREVVDDAGLEVSGEAIDHVVRLGAGSARDTLSALEQVAAAGDVDVQQVDIDGVIAALAARDAGRALVVVNEAMVAGIDARTLGVQLVERLRDVFLAAMGASLAHLSDGQRASAEALSEQIERPFLTRCLEVLGEALTKMPETPDRRILLETAVVRLADPSADPSPAALLDRIERLERALAGGGAPAAAPAAPVAPVAPVATPARAPKREVAAPAPASLPTSEGGGRGDSAAGGGAGDLPSRDELTLAWGDSILSALPRTVKARFAGGRFMSVDAEGAHFALPNRVHRDRCREVLPEVETALADHFGRPVPVVLDIEGAAAAPAAPDPAPAPERRPGAAPAVDDPDEPDIAEVRHLPDAPSEDKTGLDRLAEAFPGAELVEEESR